ncbi:MAG: response regulator [Spartobacteria bacterium]|nr:response regulator [Spartobacteria bacterium]
MTKNHDARTIMLVDDEPHFRSAMRRLIRTLQSKEEWNVIEASTGEEGLETMQQCHIDCILLDNKMPGGDGMDWLHNYVSKDEHIAVILITGQGDEQLAVSAMQRGAMDYLVKGMITPEMLECTLTGVFERVDLRKSLEARDRALLEAERNRIMVESLGAACHKLGQPATILTTSLELLKCSESDPEKVDLINTALDAADRIALLLKKFQSVAVYCSEEYVQGHGQRIVKIDD